MKRYKIKRIKVGPKAKDAEDWSLDISDAAILRDPDGNQIDVFRPDNAFAKFTFNRFARSGQHNFEILTSRGEVLYFAIWPKAFKNIQAFANNAAEASSDDNLKTLKIKLYFGLLTALIGLGYGAYEGLTTQNFKSLFVCSSMVILGVTTAIYYRNTIKSVTQA